MGKYIVMDVVFKASSLNYDQGSGNYQELKKITRWNGKQYTFVSRYAIRYSLLETGEKNSLWKLDKGEVLTRETGKNKKEGSIQPSSNALFSGKILEYPEFDLFGYLVTSTTPQNFRSAPVKLSHAVSMTPFNYDALFNANLGMANRLRKIHGNMGPNPFTSEEHETFYLYSVLIDVDSVGVSDTYMQIPTIKDHSLSEIHIVNDEDEDMVLVKGIYKSKKSTKEIEILRFPKQRINNGNVILEKIILPISEERINNSVGVPVESNEDSEVIILRYRVNNKKTRIENLVKSVLNLRRYIKGRDEDLSPKIIVLGMYENMPYKTFKDRIALVDEISEESIDEIIEETKGDKKTVRVIHKTIKSSKPKFRIYGIQKSAEKIYKENDIIEKVGIFLESGKVGKEIKEIYLYKVPEIETELPEISKQ